MIRSGMVRWYSSVQYCGTWRDRPALAWSQLRHLVGLDNEVMMRCIPYSALPGFSRLTTDFVYAFEKVAAFYGEDPWKPESLRRRVETLEYSAERRARLVEVLRRQNGESSALARLRDPRCVAVVAGQQVGLFGGPAFTFYKAITAVRLAERLCAEGVPAVAIFWLASEDHDLREVSHCWVFDQEGAPVRVSASESQEEGRRPVGFVPVPGGVVDRFLCATGGLPHSQVVAELLSRCYTSGTTYSKAFGRLLRELVGVERLLTFDPLDEAARRMLAEPLSVAVGQLPALVAALENRCAALLEAGYHLQVPIARGVSLLFLLDGEVRKPVRWEEGRLCVGGEEVRETVLAGRAAELSAGALLRPVVQDQVLPTAISVVGPSEIAYLAQSSALYDCLGVCKPVWWPRASCTLLDARASRLFARYDLKIEDFYPGELAFRELLAARLVSPELQEIIERRAAEIRKLLDRMAIGIAEAGGALPKAFDKSRRKIEYQLNKIVKGVVREQLRRDETASRHARWLYHQIFPRRTLQERVYSIVAFLAREGLDLSGRLLETVSPDCRGHQLVAI